MKRNKKMKSSQKKWKETIKKIEVTIKKYQKKKNQSNIKKRKRNKKNESTKKKKKEKTKWKGTKKKNNKKNGIIAKLTFISISKTKFTIPIVVKAKWKPSWILILKFKLKKEIKLENFNSNYIFSHT